MEEQYLETFCPASQEEWKEWLQQHHVLKQSVWLVYYKKKTGVASITWSEAVDEALCFGWIDGKAKPVDDQKFMHFFSRRKPNGTWSKVNKEKIKRLIKTGKMTQAGFEIIKAAKQNGSWTVLDEVEKLIVPSDLEDEFQTKPRSKDYYLSLSRSVRKAILQWLVLAKQPQTWQKGIVEIPELAS